MPVPDVIVLGLPRGGVPVAFEVAKALGAPLDVFLVRKLGVPGQPELAMGAIASGGVFVINEDVVSYLAIPASEIQEVAARERAELERREQLYRGGRPMPSLKGRTAIVVDDGLATGSSMRAAVTALKRLGTARVVVAVPVAPEATCHELRDEVDEIVAVAIPPDFDGVGRWYDDFSQTTDQEVCDLLGESTLRLETAAANH
ncbi:MAG TPA: phosphoribosyltransferase family protein [Blastocatellia bacterium]|nr:phosphoribosyltransferase family protein [Blastocatellia bacterium]